MPRDEKKKNHKADEDASVQELQRWIRLDVVQDTE
jgi:hypothetical protein